MDQKINDCDILISSGGKCGSLSLYFTFLEYNFKSIHTHSEIYFTNVLKFPYSVYDLIDANSAQHTIYIIDSYRTPIERKISSFFQNISLFVENYEERTVHELIEYFNEQCICQIENYHPMDEMFQHYGLSNFEEFDFNKKYNMKQEGNVVFIKIRFNDIAEWSRIISEIFNQDIVLKSHNLTSEKKIATLYNEFKKHYLVPLEYLQHIIDSDKHFRLYNSPSEQEEYINYWKANSI